MADKDTEHRSVREQLRNPFEIYGPVHGEEFVGRKDILSRLLGTARNFADAPAHYLVMGPRRIGKTSLLNRMSELIASERLGIPIRAYWLPTNSIETFAQDLESQMIRALEPRFSWRMKAAMSHIDSISVGGIQVSLKPGRRADLASARVLDLLRKLKGKTQFFFLIDEAFGLLSQKEITRFIIQLQEYAMTTVVLTTEEGYEMSEEKRRDLWRRFEVVEVGPFSEGETFQLIAARSGKYTFPVSVKKTIHQLSGGYPFHAQILCYECIREAASREILRISHSIVKVASERLLTERSQLFADELRFLPSTDRSAVEEVAVGAHVTVTSASASTGISGDDISAAFSVLERNNIVSRDDLGGYFIRSKIIEESIKRQRQTFAQGEKKQDVSLIPGKYEERVFIGGNYAFKVKLKEIATYVQKAGCVPILNDDFDIPRGKSEEYSKLLLDNCKRAIFEVTVGNGHLIEIEHAYSNQKTMNLVFEAVDTQGHPPKYLTSLLKDKKGVPLFGYTSYKELENYIVNVLSSMKS